MNKEKDSLEKTVAEEKEKVSSSLGADERGRSFNVIAAQIMIFSIFVDGGRGWES